MEEEKPIKDDIWDPLEDDEEEDSLDF